ncbi:MAG: hypothetical protein IJU36_05020 [Paludibacteraceae bacterium]|nr:hypothetical protein [Paludibacteraceae bacterium]
MKRILLTMVTVMLVSAGLFAASEQAWYNDVTTIANDGQYYIYSVNGAGFMEADNGSVITASKTKTPSLFTVTSASNGKAYSGSKYVVAYQTHTCGPIGKSTTEGSTLIWTSMDNGAYWNIHGSYRAWAADRFAALSYDGGYDASANIIGGMATQTDAKYRWYLISQDQYSRHWLIYDFDVLKEQTNLPSYATTIHQDLYTDLATAMTPTFNVQNTTADAVQAALTALQTAKAAADAYPAQYATALSDFNTARNAAQAYAESEVPAAVYNLLHAYDALTPNVVTTDLSEMQTATSNLNAAVRYAEDTKTVYATCLAKITALEAVTDKGDGDISAITTDITNARRAIDSATTSAEVTAAVATLRQIDNVTAVNTTFRALETLTDVAQAASGLLLTYTSEDLTTVDAALWAIRGGTCVIEAATQGDETYYPFMRRVTVTIAKLDPDVSVTAETITYPATVHSAALTNIGTPGTAIWQEPDETRLPGTYTGLSVLFTPTDAGVYKEVSTTTTLTVLPPTTYGEVTGGCCPGSSYYYHGQFYQPGDYTVTLRNRLGGDSIVTLHVTEYPTYDETYDVTIYSDQTFLWNCDTYTKAGTYTHTYMTRRGCDSTVTINLTVLPQKTYGEVLGDICTGEYFYFNDRYYSAGSYQEILVNHLGGDSIVTITVTEHPTFEASFDDTICSGDSLLWDGIYYKEAGSFTRHYRTIYGCDSAVTLNLALRPSYSMSESMTIASGWHESWRGKDLSGYASGVYEVYDSLTTVLGCDSVFVLNLTVIAYGPTTYGFDSAYVCPGDNYTYLDSLMTDSGTYVFRLRNSLYGDSIITFNLRYWPTYKKKSNRVIHQGVSYKWRGRQLSGYDEGSYVLWDSLRTVHGCDSLFYCTLTILPPETQYNEVYATICPGDTFYYENRQFTDSGTYELPVPEQSRFRGDSVNRIHLAWYPHYVLDNRRIMYEGQPERWRGRDLSGFPVCDTLLYDSLKTTMGCDSVFRLQLTVQMVPTTFFYDTMLICDSEPFRYCRDTLINSAGDYVFHLVNALGGDSVVSLHVEDHPSYLIEQYDTIMQGTTYHWRNRTYVLRPYDHVFMDSLRSIYGCDSVYCLYLHVNAREYLIVEEMSVCQNSVQTWHGKTLRTDSVGYFPAVERDAYYSGFDADSVYVLNLTVNASPVIDNYLTWKQGHQKTWYLEHFSTLTPGYYTFTSGRFLHTRQGCDSLEVMHLQVLPTTYGAIEVNLCPDSVYNYNGKTYSQAGVYTVIIDNHYCGTDSLGFDSGVHGDSIITLTVHQRKKYDLHPELHAAYGDTLFWRGVPHRLEVGTFVFRDTTQSVYGCDSLTTLTVFVDRAQQRIAWNPDTLSVHAADSILLRAKASSGLPVSFASSSLFYAYVTDQSWLVGRNLGQVTITAVQNGDRNYYAASPVEYVFEVLEPLPLDGLETVRPDDLDALPEGTEPEKFIHNGHLYIRTSEGLFDAAGRKITASPDTR